MAFNKLKLLVKRLLFPGLDLHTRCRYRFLPRYFKKGPIDTLDAGCGNGVLAYAAYKLGNNVWGIDYDQEKIERARRFFTSIGIDPKRLNFKVLNLYDLSQSERRFDQIICSETLEHIKRDDLIIKCFYDIMRPGGVLHLCAPYVPDSHHNLREADNPEDGGHVRDGYTAKTYELLLQSCGFKIDKIVGLGSPFFVRLDTTIRSIRAKTGDVAAFPSFLITWPLQLLDYLNPKKPYSLYEQATKQDIRKDDHEK